MKVLIVDDEALARLRLRSLVESLPELAAQVIGEAADADEALTMLREEAADVVLLDIRMPGRDGVRLAAALGKVAQRPAVIFVTAHAEHALKAFELEAVDYLTKPVRRERLLAALQRVLPRLAVAANCRSACAGSPASPTPTERGSARPSTRLRRRSRASGSSSTISTRSGGSGGFTAAPRCARCTDRKSVV